MTRKPTDAEEKANKALADKWKETATQSKEDYLSSIRTTDSTVKAVNDMKAAEAEKNSKNKSSSS